ncbi:protein root UVB sensitive 4 [Babesia caballi]|uniref:Protein root UVB sensitive 4 n=1 Tax=Babesia caballi TaxID=5871 RepID=A0AAV4LPE0_BABCB|nr:protein root UVB sensitive 4 [Babesia caballi]
MGRGRRGCTLLLLILAAIYAVPWNCVAAARVYGRKGILPPAAGGCASYSSHIRRSLGYLTSSYQNGGNGVVDWSLASLAPAAFLGSARRRHAPTECVRHTGVRVGLLNGRRYERSDVGRHRGQRGTACKLFLVDSVLGVGKNVSDLVKGVFHPHIVSDEYYRYAHWRMLERVAIAAAMALASQTQPMRSTASTDVAVNRDNVAKEGYKDRWVTWMSHSKVSSALINIVLKDVVSRAFNVVWFGKIGAGFDDNPRAFRLLGGLLCSVASVVNFAGNAFQVEPKALLNVCVNAVKQVGLATMAAAQAAFHTTFCVKNTAANVGEITAKLEVQNPICDFLGMVAGMQLGSLVTDKPVGAQVGALAGLCLTSNIATYMCAKSVCFRTLNPRRCFALLDDFSSALQRRLGRYLRYHKRRLEGMNERKEDEESGGAASSEESSSSNSCLEDGECDAIAEMIRGHEFDSFSKLLHRFTSKNLRMQLKSDREADCLDQESDVRYPDEPLNLAQKPIGVKLRTPEQVAARETLLSPWRGNTVKYSPADLSVCPATLAEYLKVFKGEQFVVALGSDGVVECAIHQSAKPRDAVLAVLTYKVAQKLWTLLDEAVELRSIDRQIQHIGDMFKRSAVSLREVLARLNARGGERQASAPGGDQLRSKESMRRRGLPIVQYAYIVAQACIDEVMRSLEAASWDLEKFDLGSPSKN